MTEFIILKADTEAGAWVVQSDQTAPSKSAALRQFLDGRSEGGKFVAVPYRSWQPVTVKVETKTALKFT